MNTTLDLTSLAQPVLAIAAIVFTAMIKAYVPAALDALQRRTGLALTDQQRATVLGAVQTAAGSIETLLDQGVLTHAHINVANDQIRAEAQAAISAVPDAAASLGMTVDGVARMIVGKVDTGSHGAVPKHLTADDVAKALIGVAWHGAPAG